MNAGTGTNNLNTLPVPGIGNAQPLNLGIAGIGTTYNPNTTSVPNTFYGLNPLNNYGEPVIANTLPLPPVIDISNAPAIPDLSGIGTTYNLNPASAPIGRTTPDIMQPSGNIANDLTVPYRGLTPDSVTSSFEQRTPSKPESLSDALMKGLGVSPDMLDFGNGRDLTVYQSALKDNFGIGENWNENNSVSLGDILSDYGMGATRGMTGISPEDLMINGLSLGKYDNLKQIAATPNQGASNAAIDMIPEITQNTPGSDQEGLWNLTPGTVTQNLDRFLTGEGSTDQYNIPISREIKNAIDANPINIRDTGLGFPMLENPSSAIDKILSDKPWDTNSANNIFDLKNGLINTLLPNLFAPQLPAMKLDVASQSGKLVMSPDVRRQIDKLAAGSIVTLQTTAHYNGEDYPLEHNFVKGDDGNLRNAEDSRWDLTYAVSSVKNNNKDVKTEAVFVDSLNMSQKSPNALPNWNINGVGVFSGENRLESLFNNGGKQTSASGNNIAYNLRTDAETRYIYDKEGSVAGLSFGNGTVAFTDGGENVVYNTPGSRLSINEPNRGMTMFVPDDLRPLGANKVYQGTVTFGYDGKLSFQDGIKTGLANGVRATAVNSGNGASFLTEEGPYVEMHGQTALFKSITGDNDKIKAALTNASDIINEMALHPGQEGEYNGTKISVDAGGNVTFGGTAIARIDQYSAPYKDSYGMSSTAKGIADVFGISAQGGLISGFYTDDKYAVGAGGDTTSRNVPKLSQGLLGGYTLNTDKASANTTWVTFDNKDSRILLVNDEAIPFAANARNIGLGVGYNLNGQIVVDHTARVDVFSDGLAQFQDGSRASIVARAGLTQTFRNVIDGKGQAVTKEGVSVTAGSWDPNQGFTTGKYLLPYSDRLSKDAQYIENVTMWTDAAGQPKFAYFGGQSIRYNGMLLVPGNNGKTLDSYDGKLYSINDTAFPVQDPSGNAKTAKVNLDIWGVIADGGVLGLITASDTKFYYPSQKGGSKGGFDLPGNCHSENLDINPAATGDGLMIGLNNDQSRLAFAGTDIMPFAAGSHNLNIKDDSKVQINGQFNRLLQDVTAHVDSTGRLQLEGVAERTVLDAQGNAAYATFNWQAGAEGMAANRNASVDLFRSGYSKIALTTQDGTVLESFEANTPGLPMGLKPVLQKLSNAQFSADGRITREASTVSILDGDSVLAMTDHEAADYLGNLAELGKVKTPNNNKDAFINDITGAMNKFNQPIKLGLDAEIKTEKDNKGELTYILTHDPSNVAAVNTKLISGFRYDNTDMNRIRGLDNGGLFDFTEKTASSWIDYLASAKDDNEIAGTIKLKLSGGWNYEKVDSNNRGVVYGGARKEYGGLSVNDGLGINIDPDLAKATITYYSKNSDSSAADIYYIERQTTFKAGQYQSTVTATINQTVVVDYTGEPTKIPVSTTTTNIDTRNVGFNSVAAITARSHSATDDKGTIHTYYEQFDNRDLALLSTIDQSSMEYFDTLAGNVRNANSSGDVRPTLNSMIGNNGISSQYTQRTAGGEWSILRTGTISDNTENLFISGKMNSGETITTSSVMTNRDNFYYDQLISEVSSDISGSRTANDLSDKLHSYLDANRKYELGAISFTGIDYKQFEKGLFNRTNNGMLASFNVSQGVTVIGKTTFDNGTATGRSSLGMLYPDGQDWALAGYKEQNAKGTIVYEKARWADWVMPDKISNVYMSKMDTTPTGQAISVRFGDNDVQFKSGNGDIGVFFPYMADKAVPVTISSVGFDQKYTGGVTEFFSVGFNGGLVPEGAIWLSDGKYSINANSMEMRGSGLEAISGTLTVSAKDHAAPIATELGTWKEASTPGDSSTPKPKDVYQFTYVDGKITDGTVAFKNGSFVMIPNRTTVIDGSGRKNSFTDVEITSDGIQRGPIARLVGQEQLNAQIKSYMDKQFNTYSMPAKSPQSTWDALYDIRKSKDVMYGEIAEGNYSAALVTLGEVKNLWSAKTLAEIAAEDGKLSLSTMQGVSRRLLVDIGAASYGDDGKFTLSKGAYFIIREKESADPSITERVNKAVRNYQDTSAFYTTNIYNTTAYGAWGEWLYENNHKAEIVTAALAVPVGIALTLAPYATVASSLFWGGTNYAVEYGLSKWNNQEFLPYGAFGRALGAAYTAAALKGTFIALGGALNGFSVTNSSGNTVFGWNGLASLKTAQWLIPSAGQMANMSGMARAGAILKSAAVVGSVFGLGNAGWQLYVNANGGEGSLGGAFLKGFAFGSAMKLLSMSNISVLNANKATWWTAGAKIATVSSILGGLNFAYDSFNGAIQNPSDGVRSFFKGFVWGIAMYYGASAAGAEHAGSISTRIGELGKTGAAIASDAFFRTSVSGAAMWVGVSPAFTLFEAAWTGIGTGLYGCFVHGFSWDSFVNNAKWGTENFGEIKSLKDLGNALVISAIQGPVQGLYMGPMIYMFSRPPENPIAAAKQPGFLGQMKLALSYNNINTIAGPGRLIGQAFIQQLIGNAEMASFVTGLNKVLSLITQAGEGRAGISAKGGAFSEQNALAWFGMFAKPHSWTLVDKLPSWMQWTPKPAYDRLTKEVAAREIDYTMTGLKDDLGRPLNPNNEPIPGYNADPQYDPRKDVSRNSSQAASGDRVISEHYNDYRDGELANLARDPSADYFSRMKAGSDVFSGKVVTPNAVEFTQDVLNGNFDGAELFKTPAYQYSLGLLAKDDSIDASAKKEFFEVLVKRAAGKMDNSKDPQLTATIAGKDITIKVSDLIGSGTVADMQVMLKQACNAIGISQDGFWKGVYEIIQGEKAKQVLFGEEKGKNTGGLSLTPKEISDLSALVPYYVKYEVLVKNVNDGLKNLYGWVKDQVKITAARADLAISINNRDVRRILNGEGTPEEVRAIQDVRDTLRSQDDINTISVAGTKKVLDIWKSDDPNDIVGRHLYTIELDRKNAADKDISGWDVSKVLNDQGSRKAIKQSVLNEMAGVVSGAHYRAMSAAWLAGGDVNGINATLDGYRTDPESLKQTITGLKDKLKTANPAQSLEIASKLAYLLAFRANLIERSDTFVSTLEGFAFYIFATENAMKGGKQNISSLGRLWQGKGKMDALISAQIAASIVDPKRAGAIILPGDTSGSFTGNKLVEIYLNEFNGKVITFDNDTRTYTVYEGKEKSVITRDDPAYKEMGEEAGLYIISHRDIQFLKLEEHPILTRLQNVSIDEVDAYLTGTAAIIGNPYFSILATDEVKNIFNSVVKRYDAVNEEVAAALGASKDLQPIAKGSEYEDRFIPGRDDNNPDNAQYIRLKNGRATLRGDILEKVVTSLSNNAEFQGFDEASREAIIKNLIESCVTVYLYENGTNYYTKGKGEYGIAGADTREMPNTIWGDRSMAVFLALKHSWGELTSETAINYSVSRTSPIDTIKALKNAHVWGDSGTLDGVGAMARLVDMRITGIEPEPKMQDFKGVDGNGRYEIILADAGKADPLGNRATAIDTLTSKIEDVVTNNGNLAPEDQVRIHAIRYEGVKQGAKLQAIADKLNCPFVDVRFEGQTPRLFIDGVEQDYVGLAGGKDDVVKAVNNYLKSNLITGNGIILGFQGLGPGVNALAGIEGARANVYATNFNNYALLCQIVGRRGTFLDGIKYEPVKGQDGAMVSYEGKEGKFGTRASGDAYIIIDIGLDRKISDKQADQLRQTWEAEGEEAAVQKLEIMMREADYDMATSSYYQAAYETFKMAPDAAATNYKTILQNTDTFSAYPYLTGVPISLGYINTKLGNDPAAADTFNNLLSDNRFVGEDGALNINGMMLLRNILGADSAESDFYQRDWSNVLQNGALTGSSNANSSQRQVVGTFLGQFASLPSMVFIAGNSTNSAESIVSKLKSGDALTVSESSQLLIALNNAGLIDINDPARGFSSIVRMAVIGGLTPAIQAKSMTLQDIEAIQLSGSPGLAMLERISDQPGVSNLRSMVKKGMPITAETINSFVDAAPANRAQIMNAFTALSGVAVTAGNVEIVEQFISEEPQGLVKTIKDAFNDTRLFDQLSLRDIMYVAKGLISVLDLVQNVSGAKRGWFSLKAAGSGQLYKIATDLKADADLAANAYLTDDQITAFAQSHGIEAPQVRALLGNAIDHREIKTSIAENAVINAHLDVYKTHMANNDIPLAIAELQKLDPDMQLTSTSADGTRKTITVSDLISGLDQNLTTTGTTEQQTVIPSVMERAAEPVSERNYAGEIGSLISEAQDALNKGDYTKARTALTIMQDAYNEGSDVGAFDNMMDLYIKGTIGELQIRIAAYTPLVQKPQPPQIPPASGITFSPASIAFGLKFIGLIGVSPIPEFVSTIAMIGAVIYAGYKIITLTRSFFAPKVKALKQAPQVPENVLRGLGTAVPQAAPISPAANQMTGGPAYMLAPQMTMPGTGVVADQIRPMTQMIQAAEGLSDATKAKAEASLTNGINDSYSGNVASGRPVVISYNGTEYTLKGEGKVGDVLDNNKSDMMEAFGLTEDQFGAMFNAMKNDWINNYGSSYEVGFAVLTDGTVKFGHKAIIELNPDGTIGKMACSEFISPKDNVLFRGHTHPDYAAPDSNEWKEKSALDQKNLDNGAFGAIKGIIIVQKRADGTLVPTMLARAPATIGAANIDTAMANIFTSGWTVQHSFAASEGAYAESIQTPTQAVIDLMANAKPLVEAIARRDKEAIVRALCDVEKTLKISDSGAATAQLSALTNLAMLLKEAGFFEGQLLIGIESRNGAYDGESLKAILGTINTARNDNVIRYVVIADPNDANVMKACDAAKVDTTSDIGNYAAGLNITNNSFIAIATTDNALEIVSNNKTNYFIGNKDALVNEEGKVPAGTLLTAMQRAVFASQAAEEKSVVIAVGCSDAAIKNLQDIFKGNCRLFRLAKLEIDKLVRAFMTAIEATAKSL